MNHEISATPSTRRLNILSGHLLVPNAAAAQAAAPAKTVTSRAPKGNFKDCKIVSSFNYDIKGWNHLGLDEYMSEKAKKMKAQIE